MRNPFKRRSGDRLAASRYEGMFRSVRTRERKHMRHWWQWAGIGVLVLLVAFSAFLWVKYKQAEDDVQIPDLVLPVTEEQEPFNVLLVGSDSREGLTEDEQLELGAGTEGVTGERADTLILAHIDPATNRITMVQFPRDLYVDVLGEGDARINESLQSGPKHLVRAVEDLSGVTINKYAQVNIAGFRDLVDAIGGVEVCITEPVPFDSNTGIEITPDEVGMVRFDGDRAIRFVRSRKVFATGDFARIQNQQKFLSAAIDKVVSAGTILRPDRIVRLLNIVGDNMSTDANTTLNGLRKLGNRFREFDPETYEAYTVPNLGSVMVKGASVVAPDEAGMKVMFEAILANESPAAFDGVPDVEPSTIRVGVYNGTFEEGIASAAAAKLQTATDTGAGPVEVAEVANARRPNFKLTQIRFGPEAANLAELVAAALPGAELVERRTRPGLDVEVIVGKRFRTKKLVQLLPIPLPPPSDLPPECR